MKTKVFIDAQHVDLRVYVSSLISHGGIGIHAQDINKFTKGVKTYVFSESLNPLPNYPISFMNEGFKKLIQEGAGSVFWTDEDEKFLSISLIKDNKERIAWGSHMNYISKELLETDPHLINILKLINKLEQYHNKVSSDISRIVITFDNCFLSPVRGSIIQSKFSELINADISTLPFLELPYHKSKF